MQCLNLSTEELCFLLIALNFVQDICYRTLHSIH